MTSVDAVDIPLQQMPLDAYAQVQTAVGARVERVGGVYWNRVRRIFCRPLLPHEELPANVAEERRSGCAGFQYVVADPQAANSAMGFIVLEREPDYSLEAVSHNRRRLIKSAAKKMEVRPIRDLPELQTQGYAAYAAFYRRTRYEYLAARRREVNFRHWATAQLQDPRATVLGAYWDGRLAAVSVAFWVRDTLLYATHFSGVEALRQGASELLLHALRAAVARTPGIAQILVRRYQGGNGMDQYYLMRGAKLVHKPARLQLEPLVRLGLRICRPRQYALLQGPHKPRT